MTIQGAQARHPLDRLVGVLEAELESRRVLAPDCLFLLATGCGSLPEALSAPQSVTFAELELPAPWQASRMHAGRLGELAVWLLEDSSGDPLEAPAGPGWERALPLWLAAKAGAPLLIHVSAGSALASESGPRAPVGGIGVVRDHVNLSGATPLIGLGGSRLGPLFPDVSALHHLGLRRSALVRAEALGLSAAEVVAACTPGPSLETPAERGMYARLGADVSVQSLQWPLLAAAHAGLAVLALVAVSDAGEGAADVTGLVEAARVQAPLLEDLLLASLEDFEHAVRALREDGA